jgi:diguanylate cyclase (GGDEF)-like protein
MHDQVLIWNTDANLEITSFTARLRDFVGVAAAQRSIHVRDLWPEDSPYSVPELAHRWALDGESVSFEVPAHGTTFRFDVSPLYGRDGEIVGVTGRAVDLARLNERGLRPGAYAQAEKDAGVGFWHDDLRTGRTTMSGGMRALLGIDPSVTSLDLRAFDHPEDRSEIARVLNDPESAERYTCDHRVCFGNSRVRAVRERVQTVFDVRGVAVARLGTLLDITDFKEREADLADLALSDPLTRLANRALLFERLATAISRTRRYGTLCGVLFIDLDGFKSVNDTLGHDAGDQLLRKIAHHLLVHFRPTDTVARLGGDEFVVVVEDIYSAEAAASAAEKLLRSLEQIFELTTHAVRISASIGVAIIPTSSEDPAELLAIADAEMYGVKRSGGRGVRVATPGSLRSA